MVDALRRVGIAVGSFVAALLVVSLVGSLVIGPAAQGAAIWWLAVVVLAGLIYLDIVSTDRVARGQGGSGRGDLGSMTEAPHSTREWLTALLVVGVVAAAVVGLLVLFYALLAQPSVG